MNKKLPLALNIAQALHALPSPPPADHHSVRRLLRHSLRELEFMHKSAATVLADRESRAQDVRIAESAVRMFAVIDALYACGALSRFDGPQHGEAVHQALSIRRFIYTGSR